MEYPDELTEPLHVALQRSLIGSTKDKKPSARRASLFIGLQYLRGIIRLCPGAFRLSFCKALDIMIIKIF